MNAQQSPRSFVKSLLLLVALLPALAMAQAWPTKQPIGHLGHGADFQRGQ